MPSVYATETYRLVVQWMPADLAKMSIDYIAPTNVTDYEVARTDMIELWSLISDPNAGLLGACASNNASLAHEMIERGACSWDEALGKACVHASHMAGSIVAIRAYKCSHCDSDRCKRFGHVGLWGFIASYNYAAMLADSFVYTT